MNQQHDVATLAARRKPVTPPPGAIPMDEAARLFRSPRVTVHKWALYGADATQLDSFLFNGRRFTTRDAVDRFNAEREASTRRTPKSNPRGLEPDTHAGLRALDASLSWLADALRTGSDKRRRGEEYSAAEKIHTADVVQCLAASLARCDALEVDDEFGGNLIDEARDALERVLRVAGCDAGPELPRRVASAWPRIASKTAGIQFGGTRRRKRRGRLFRTSQPVPFQSRRPTAEESHRKPLGLWLKTDRRRILRREGHAAEIPLSRLQYAVLGKMLDCARLDLPCPVETLRTAWTEAGITAAPCKAAVDYTLRELRDLIAGVGVTFEPGRFLGYFLEPLRKRGTIAPAARFEAGEFEAGARWDVREFFEQARGAAWRTAPATREPIATPCRVRLAFLDLRIDPVAGTVHHEGFAPIRLNRTRLQLLRILADAEGRFVNVDQLHPAWTASGTTKPGKGTIVRQIGILASELGAIGLGIESNVNGRRLIELPAA